MSSTSRFDARFEVASPTEQPILEAMAREAGAVRLARLRQHLPEQVGFERLVDRILGLLRAVLRRLRY